MRIAVAAKALLARRLTRSMASEKIQGSTSGAAMSNLSARSVSRPVFIGAAYPLRRHRREAAADSHRFRARAKEGLIAGTR
jgi:hypothetical protein